MHSLEVAVLSTAFWRQLKGLYNALQRILGKEWVDTHKVGDKISKVLMQSSVGEPAGEGENYFNELSEFFAQIRDAAIEADLQLKNRFYFALIEDGLDSRAENVVLLRFEGEFVAKGLTDLNLSKASFGGLCNSNVVELSLGQGNYQAGRNGIFNLRLFLTLHPNKYQKLYKEPNSIQ